MDLGTAPLFDLTAPVADEAAGAATETPLTRSQELLAGIRADQAAIIDREIAKVRRIAEWASEHTVDLPEDASTITERGLDTGLPIAGDGAPLISDFALMELAAVLGRSLDSGRAYIGQIVELAYRLSTFTLAEAAGDLHATYTAIGVDRLAAVVAGEEPAVTTAPAPA